MTQPRASARLFGAAALVLVSLTVCFLFTSVGAAQEQRETKPLALILVVDTSGSMEPLFEGVRESAKGIIDDCHIDDRVVLITFDDRHRGYPPWKIEDELVKDDLKDLIDSLRPVGSHTYIADALQAAFEAADRLEAAEDTVDYTQLALIVTDGRNEPPPDVVGTEDELKLAEVAARYRGKPWFVWQVQLGQELDTELSAELEKSLGDRYDEKLVPDLDSIREDIEREFRGSTIKFATGSVSFGKMEPGGSKEVRIAYDRDRRGAVGPVGLEVGDVAEAVQLTVEPHRWQSEPGEHGEIVVSVEVSPDAAPDRYSGEIALTTEVPKLKLSHNRIQWDLTVPGPPFPWWKFWLFVGIAAAVVAVLLGLRWLAKRPRVHGTLRYWREGGGEEECDLSSFNRLTLNVGAGESNDINIDVGDGQLILMCQRSEGENLCVLRPTGNVELVFEGKSVSFLQLYDRDRFTAGDVTFEYRGDVSTRPYGT